MGKVMFRIAYTKWSELPTEQEYVDTEVDFDVDNGSPRVLSVRALDSTTGTDGDAQSKRYEIDQVFAVESSNLYDNLIGKMLTYIDATFTDPEQRKAHKDIVKQMIWDIHNDRQRYARDTQK